MVPGWRDGRSLAGCWVLRAWSKLGQQMFHLTGYRYDANVLPAMENMHARGVGSQCAKVFRLCAPKQMRRQQAIHNHKL